MIWFTLSGYYIEADSREVWQKYRGEFTRKVINLITQNCRFFMFFNMALILVGLLVLLLFAFEFCIVGSCVPEYKGTYDET